MPGPPRPGMPPRPCPGGPPPPRPIGPFILGGPLPPGGGPPNLCIPYIRIAVRRTALAGSGSGTSKIDVPAAFARYVPEATMRGQGKAGQGGALASLSVDAGAGRERYLKAWSGVGVAGLQIGPGGSRPVQAAWNLFLWRPGWLDGWTRPDEHY